ASIRLGNSGTVAEEGDVHAVRIARRIADPAGDVPPLGAEFRMAAMIARKAQLASGRYLRIVHFGIRGSGGDRERQRQKPASVHRRDFGKKVATLTGLP